MSLKTIFTALADQVRRLSGRTGMLGVEAMTDALSGVKLGVDASGLTAGANDVILDKEFIGASGGRQVGTMVNHGAVDITLDAASKIYSVPAGYHNGEGKVRAVTQTKTVSPTSSDQTVYPDSGKLLSAVTVQGAAGGYTGTVTIAASQTTGVTVTSVTVNTGVQLAEEDQLFLFLDAAATKKRDVVCARRLSADDIVAYKTTSDGDYRVNDHLGGIGVSYTGTSFSVFNVGENGAYHGCFRQGDTYRWVLVKRY